MFPKIYIGKKYIVIIWKNKEYCLYKSWGHIYLRLMKKIIFISIIIMLFLLYGTPLWGMEKSIADVTPDNKTDILIETNDPDEEYMFQAGVEEILDIVIDIQEDVDIKSDSTKYTGWASTRVNVRKEPNTDSEILKTLEFNEKIEYQLYNDEWVKINHNGTSAYVYKKYVSKNINKYVEYSVPSNSGFKSYMSYKAITNKNSKQYKLQQKAYTGNYGIRMVNDRYCIALGTHFNKDIGTYCDLILKNGTVIKCVLGDIKSSAHTYEDNITSFNGCISEFIIDSEHLNKAAKTSGDISSCNKAWDSPVVKIKFY